MKAEKERVLVSACLLGCRCRYDGESNKKEDIIGLQEKLQLIPVCPEQLGGLATPRLPAEILEEKVVTRSGKDVTEQFERGAEEALKLGQLFGCRCAVLKARSPSCGSGIIYDGTFSKRKVPGNGKTAELLKKHGISVFTEAELDKLTEYLEMEKES